MKKIKMPISYILSVIIIALSIFSLAPSTQATTALPKESCNIHRHDYYGWFRWAQPDYSYLYLDEDGNYVRAEYSEEDGGVIIEAYNKEFKLISSSILDIDDECFGSLYIGEEYNYILTGNTNYEENDSKTVFRITKYNKDWSKLGCAELKGANTISPFWSGNAKMLEYNNYLYVRTCHKMYETSDGLNHQANVGIVVDTDTMEITDSATNIWNIATGYVSHSFNQYIIADEQTGSLVTLDHGDGYPRSFVICRFDGKLGASSFGIVSDYFETVSFSGPVGYNGTGASVGGFLSTSDGYLQAITYIGDDVELSTDSDYYTEMMRDLYTVFTDRETGETTLNKITDINKESERLLNPFLIDCGNGNFLLMWELEDRDYNCTSYSFIVNSKGEPVSPIIKGNAELSDCLPIVDGDNAYWYVTDENGISFYSANIETAEIKKENTIAFNYEEEEEATQPEEDTQPEESTVPEESTEPEESTAPEENTNQTVNGDVNADERITVVDAKLILKYIAGLAQLDDGQQNAADMDDNGKITIVDAKWVLQIVAGLR